MSRKQKVARGRAVWTAVAFSSGTQDPLLPSTQTGHNHHNKTQKRNPTLLVISSEQHHFLALFRSPFLTLPSRPDSTRLDTTRSLGLSPLLRCQTQAASLRTLTYSSLQSVSNIIPPHRPALPLLNLAHRLLASFVSASQTGYWFLKRRIVLP